MTTADLNVANLSAQQLLALRSQLLQLDAAESARKTEVAVGFAQAVVNEFAPAPFSSGAVGVHLNGKGDVKMPDGSVENWTVSVLVRRTSTIPARKAKGNPVTVTKIPAADETVDTTP